MYFLMSYQKACASWITKNQKISLESNREKLEDNIGQQYVRIQHLRYDLKFRKSFNWGV